MSFPGRNKIAFPWKIIVVILVLVLTAVYGIRGLIRGAVAPQKQPEISRRGAVKTGPGTVRKGVDRVEDNVKQIFFGNPFVNPKERTYTTPVQFPMSSTRGDYYKDKK